MSERYDTARRLCDALTTDRAVYRADREALTLLLGMFDELATLAAQSLKVPVAEVLNLAEFEADAAAENAAKGEDS